MFVGILLVIAFSAVIVAAMWVHSLIEESRYERLLFMAAINLIVAVVELLFSMAWVLSAMLGNQTPGFSIAPMVMQMSFCAAFGAVLLTSLKKNGFTPAK